MEKRIEDSKAQGGIAEQRNGEPMNVDDTGKILIPRSQIRQLTIPIKLPRHRVIGVIVWIQRHKQMLQQQERADTDTYYRELAIRELHPLIDRFGNRRSLCLADTALP